MNKGNNSITRSRQVNSEQGFTLLEVLIAICILSIGLLGVAAMQVSATQGNSFASHLSEAVTYGQDKVEELMIISYGHSDLDAGAHTEASPPAGYTVNWSIEDDPDIDGDGSADMDNAKLIEVTVTWQTKGESHSTTLRSIRPEIPEL
jgi:prepilin-type N-terminal cleavage/methylation domain-containing protein